MLSAVPESLRPAVAHAIEAVLPSGSAGALTPMSGGLSGALVYRLEAAGRAFILRLEQGRDLLRDPHRWRPLMIQAAEAGLAPAVHYADADEGVMIVDFVAERPRTELARVDLLQGLARTVRRLHDLPPSSPVIDSFQAVDMAVAEAQVLGLAPTAVLQAVAEAGRRLRITYPDNPADLVASHNDLNPRNVIYDGARFWFVDWEAAFGADRYVDLAGLANFFARDPAEAELLLAAYFPGEVSAVERARFTLMRLVNKLFLGLTFLKVAALEQPRAKLELGWDDGPSLADLHRALAEGRPVLDSWAGRAAYGQARLRAAFSGMETTETAAAIRTLAA